ncbi:hypothetical protein V1L52_05810 [Treponema sp. HNW]|uniref:hypothetical protein n=1 Tax=Treponema sp. HNW TaxID=3116654 RepID=UPI003D10E7F8
MREKKEEFDFPHYEYRRLHCAYIPSTAFVSVRQGKSDSRFIIREGDEVSEGQIIASGYKNAVPVHAPIPGIVSEIAERTMPDGSRAECAVLQFRGGFAFEGKEQVYTDYRKKQGSHKLIPLIRQHGIINTFDLDNNSLAEQLDKAGSDNYVLAVRLFDFDPGCSRDGFISSFFTKEVIEGACLCARAMHTESLVFFYGGEDFRLPDEKTLEALCDTISCRFIKIDTRFYPSGSQRVLEKILQKNTVQHTKPGSEKAFRNFEKGKNKALFIDSATAYAVYRCLCLSVPFTDTVVEVNGPALHESKMFKVKIGTPIRRLLEECGGCEKEPAKIIINGLIKGTAVSDLDIPVTKYVKTVTLLSADSIPDQRISDCIHCGFCRKACPLGIQSDRIYSHFVNKTPLGADILLSAHLCDDCALCNAACPARLPLYQTVSKYKEKQDAAQL